MKNIRMPKRVEWSDNILRDDPVPKTSDHGESVASRNSPQLNLFQK